VKPRVELWPPKKRGKYYSAAARVRFDDGDLDIVARASSKLAAKALANLHGWAAITIREDAPPQRTYVGAAGDVSTVAGPAEGALLASLRSIVDAVKSGDPGRISSAHERLMIAAASVPRDSSVWDDLSKAIAVVSRGRLGKAAKPHFDSAKRIISFVGPLMASPSIGHREISAAATLVSATQSSGTKSRLSKDAIRAIARRAKAGSRSAKKATILLRQAARVTKAGPKALLQFSALARAAALLRAARKGEREAAAQIRSLTERALEGEELAVEAFALLQVALIALEETDEMFVQFDELDEEHWKEVAGRQSRALDDAELIRRLDVYRSWNRDHRRTA